MNSKQIAMLALTAAAWLTPRAEAQSAQAPAPDGYETGDFGRIRSADDGVTILRAETEQGQTALQDDDVNAPVFPADVLRTDSRQRVEVQLASGSIVRLDNDTAVTFLAMPDPYAEIPDHTVLQLADGAIRVTTRGSQDDEFRLDTASATVYLVGEVDLRLEVAGSGRTSVASHRGVAEVVGEAGSVILRAGMRTEVDPGALPRDPTPFPTLRADGFDSWVAERETMYQALAGGSGGGAVYASLPEPVRNYYGELSANGSWVETEEFGTVWVPRGVDDGWRPYYQGSWVYGPSGYFWVGAEPWGWAPYHYGRWNYLGPHGWCWIPGVSFAGAWVSWSFGDAYVGWGPLDYWNYPAWHSSLYLGFYDPFAWTFVSYGHFGHYHCGVYGADWHHVNGHLHNAAIVTRPPRVAPSRLAVSPEARQDAVQHLRADGTSRLHAAERRREPSDSFRNVENERPRRADPRPAVGARSANDSGRSLAAVPSTRFPRRLSGEGATATRTRTAVPSDRAPRQIAPRSTGEPMRDVYRRMAQPRPTRPQVPAPPRSATVSPAPAVRGEVTAPANPATPAPTTRPRSIPTRGRPPATPTPVRTQPTPTPAPAPSPVRTGPPPTRVRTEPTAPPPKATGAQSAPPRTTPSAPSARRSAPGGRSAQGSGPRAAPGRGPSSGGSKPRSAPRTRGGR